MILLELFLTFFKIGLFTFGGGYAMLPLIQAETASHGWISEEELINFIAVSESTPGPFAVNISTYIGMTTGGFAGAFSATLGVVSPSFLIILLVAKFYEKFRENKVVSGCMSGLKPAVVGMIGDRGSDHFSGKYCFLFRGLFTLRIYKTCFFSITCSFCTDAYTNV